MALASSVIRFLNSNGIHYREHVHARTQTLEQTAGALHVPSRQFARAVLLADDHFWLMAIVPLNGVLQLEKVAALFDRHLQPLSAEQYNNRFHDCEPGSCPPFPDVYGLNAVVDESLFGLDPVYLEAGSHSVVISLSANDFDTLMGRAKRAAITNTIPQGGQIAPTLDPIELPTAADVQRKLEQVYRLPAFPAVASQILQLVADPEATAKDLAELVEMDPSIAAQVIRYARSSFFGYRGNVDSIQTAITRVLGFDIVSNLALGIAAGKVFKLANDGPLGLEQFWTHAVHNAALVQALTRRCNRVLGIKPGTAYLCGLLHNFGVLLLGQVFQSEYFLLNKSCLANPEMGIVKMEQQLFGRSGGGAIASLSHNYLGAWLMRHWKMPEEVIAATEHHHNYEYSGEAQNYVYLVQLANILLARQNLGDDVVTAAPIDALHALGLTESDLLEVFAAVQEGAEELNRMAKLMAGNEPTSSAKDAK